MSVEKGPANVETFAAVKPGAALLRNLVERVTLATEHDAEGLDIEKGDKGYILKDGKKVKCSVVDLLPGHHLKVHFEGEPPEVTHEINAKEFHDETPHKH